MDFLGAWGLNEKIGAGKEGKRRPADERRNMGLDVVRALHSLA